MFCTRLYYYGARFYDAALGRFTTVDPMAGKYPNSNPYNYCFSNPIKIKDAFGLDTILVDKKGNFSENKLKDIKNDFDIVLKASRKEVRDNKITYNNGSLSDRRKFIQIPKNSINTYRSKFTLKGNKEYPYTLIQFNGDNIPENAEKLFRFLEKNTSVEWSYLSYFSNKESADVSVRMSTSHKGGEEGFMGAFVLNTWNDNNPFGDIISLLHTHPNNDLRSSPADRNVRNQIRALGQIPIFSILSGGEVRDYNNDEDE